MAYDEFQVDRIKQYFSSKKVHFETRKMMGAICFMVNDKMCCGTHLDKKTNEPLLMARIGEAAMETAMNRPGAKPMNFTGRPMKGFVFVGPEGIDTDVDLAYWLDLALAFNPLAKVSKKRKKKK